MAPLVYRIRPPNARVLRVLTNLYYERHAYVYDLVTTARTRSKGHGEALMKHVEELARREGCKYIALACGRGQVQAAAAVQRRIYG